MISTNAVLRAATRPINGPFNVLAFPTNPDVLSLIGKAGHNVYVLRSNNVVWDFGRHPIIPDNIVLLGQTNPIINAFESERIFYQIPQWLDIDFMLSSTRQTDEYNITKSLCRFLHLPHIACETGPLPNQDLQAAQLADAIADINVFNSVSDRDSWKAFNEINSIVVDHNSEEAKVQCWNKILKQASYIIYRGT